MGDAFLYYMVSIADANICALLNVGERIAVGTMTAEGELRMAYSVERN